MIEPGEIHLARIPSLDMALPVALPDPAATEAPEVVRGLSLGEIGRLIAHTARQVAVGDWTVVFHLTGGYKAMLPYFLVVAEAVQTVLVEKAGRDPQTVRAYCLHEESQRPVELPIRWLSLGNFAAAQRMSELACTGVDVCGGQLNDLVGLYLDPRRPQAAQQAEHLGNDHGEDIVGDQKPDVSTVVDIYVNSCLTLNRYRGAPNRLPERTDRIDVVQLRGALEDPAFDRGFRRHRRLRAVEVAGRGGGLALERFAHDAIPEDLRSRAARTRFLVWSLYFRLQAIGIGDAFPQTYPLPGAQSAPRLTHAVLLEYARRAREDWLGYLNAWESDPGLRSCTNPVADGSSSNCSGSWRPGPSKARSVPRHWNWPNMRNTPPTICAWPQISLKHIGYQEVRCSARHAPCCRAHRSCARRRGYRRRHRWPSRYSSASDTGVRPATVHSHCCSPACSAPSRCPTGETACCYYGCRQRSGSVRWHC